jgi:bifunctional oligoribonuclease and PAP phosphatase NrnA
MERSPIQQTIELIEKSNNIVIALPKDPSVDAVASGLGLYLSLEKIGKKAKVVCNEFSVPPAHQFLPKSKEIHAALTAMRKFIISLDLSRTKVQELSYDITDNKLNIFITPKGGFFETRDVSTSASAYDHDLIIIIDAPDLEALGKVYDDNTEFFYHTPIVNIDHNPANEYFGQINIVDLVATSTSEIIFELIKEFKEPVLDEYIATSFLAGIISKTKSFQNNTVTPKSLAISSHLIENGARRDEIIKNLYRTKSINTLKLWGRALARLKTELDGKIVWSLLNQQDFIKSGTKEADLDGVIDELIINTPNAEAVAILYEGEGNAVKMIVNTIQTIDGVALCKDFSPTGARNFTKCIFSGKNLLEAEAAALVAFKGFFNKR